MKKIAKKFRKQYCAPIGPNQNHLEDDYDSFTKLRDKKALIVATKKVGLENEKNPS